MSDVVIEAAGLGKKYVIGHRADNGRSVALRDVLTQYTHGIWRKTRDLLQGKPIVQGDMLEEVWALRDVSFQIHRSDVVGIIGRNGAGKSTLLKILSRITEPSSGRLKIKGRVASLLEVGTGFHSDLTGRENIFLNGTILGMRREEIKRRFDEIVAFAEVEKFLDTPVKRYSSGMYVRLAFAVAAHLEPEILVVDEVLAVGDAAFQKKCLGKMGQAATEGRTILFVSHNMGAINDLCSRCLLFDQGYLVGVGSTQSITRTYLSQQASKTGEISFVPRGGEAYFDALSLWDDAGEAATAFDVRRAIIIQMRFTLAHRTPGLQVSLDVFNDRGDRIFYHSNAYAEPPLSVEDSGSHKVAAQIPGNLLVPGTYSVNVALHRPNVQMYDFREHILSFEVKETGSGRYDFPSSGIGCVLVDVKWRKTV